MMRHAAEPQGECMAAKLKASYDKAEEIPEGEKAFYEEVDGKFVLSVEIRDHPGAKALHSALQKERDAKDALEKRLKKFGDRDPEAIEKLEVAAQKAEEVRLRAEGNFDTLRQQIIEKHDAEIKKLRDENTDILAFVQTTVGENVARQALEKNGANVDLMLPHVLKHVKVVRDGSKFVAQVLDEKGTPRIADAKGNPFTIVGLVEEMKASETYAAGFRGTGAAGSGSLPSSTITPGGRVEIISRAEAADSMVYQQRKAAAEKEGRELQIEPLPPMRTA